MTYTDLTETDPIQPGDIVRPRQNAVHNELMGRYTFQLRSGCSAYDDAVCISTQPFILVSRETDMRWSATVKPEYFEVIGRAPPGLFDDCMRRATK